MNESYLNKAKSGEVKTATTSVSNQNCFTKGSNKRANVADYANTGGGANKKNKKPRCVRTVPNGHRTNVDRPKLVGNANDSRMGLSGKFLKPKPGDPVGLTGQKYKRPVA